MSATPDTVKRNPRHISIKTSAANLSHPTATANPAPSASAYPPQSAAYPAMPQAMPSAGATDARLQSSASAFVASPPCESGSEKQVATGSECSPQSSSSDDTVIAGRKGSASGTIAVPSTQTTVPWPAVPGAPPGYPGDWHNFMSTWLPMWLLPHVVPATCAQDIFCYTNKHLI